MAALYFQRRPVTLPSLDVGILRNLDSASAGNGIEPRGGGEIFGRTVGAHTLKESHQRVLRPKSHRHATYVGYRTVLYEKQIPFAVAGEAAKPTSTAGAALASTYALNCVVQVTVALAVRRASLIAAWVGR
jgi:hypothetical protein